MFVSWGHKMKTNFGSYFPNSLCETQAEPIQKYWKWKLVFAYLPLSPITLLLLQVWYVRPKEMSLSSLALLQLSQMGRHSSFSSHASEGIAAQCWLNNGRRICASERCRVQFYGFLKGYLPCSGRSSSLKSNIFITPETFRPENCKTSSVVLKLAADHLIWRCHRKKRILCSTNASEASELLNLAKLIWLQRGTPLPHLLTQVKVPIIKTSCDYFHLEKLSRCHISRFLTSSFIIPRL